VSLDDKYTYPGSNGVLINKLSLRTHDQLDNAMNEYASLVVRGPRPHLGTEIKTIGRSWHVCCLGDLPHVLEA
jgi:hypothetical protein